MSVCGLCFFVAGAGWVAGGGVRGGGGGGGVALGLLGFCWGFRFLVVLVC